MPSGEAHVVLHNLAYIFIMAGFVLLVLNSMGRRARRSRQKMSPLAVWWLRWGDFVALGMILAGMLRLPK
jgi:hypothetical protein